MAQVIVDQSALHELCDLTRQAAFSLRSTEPKLADALTGVAAHVALSVTSAPERDPVPC